MAKNLWNLSGKSDSLWIRWIHSYYTKQKDILEVPLKKSSSWILKKLLKVRDEISSLQEGQQMLTKDKFHTKGMYLALLEDDQNVAWRSMMYGSLARLKIESNLKNSSSLLNEMMEFEGVDKDVKRTGFRTSTKEMEISPENVVLPEKKTEGLVPAILETSQYVEHRVCVKHLYGNWRKKYPGIHMKEVLWRAARASTRPTWERVMNQMKDLNAKAWKDMMDVPPACWSRSHFKTDSQCDLQVNNMCEAFNRAILEYRDKPIITLLEGIKHYITVRISTQKEKLSRYTSAISPNIQKVLEKTKREAERWSETWHSDDDFAIFGVSNSIETYIVNLLQKTCACRRWDLTGIPCCHAIACIWFNKKDPKDYVSSFYRRSTVMATYSYIIMPTNGPQLWSTNVTQPINPPVMRRSIGRPKKNRNKSNDEPRNRNILPISLQTVKCKKCGSFGHNKRTCKGKRVAERAIPKGGNKKTKNGNKGVAQTVIDGGSQAPNPTQE
ncbi:uncharacterized protein LOC131659882 [Vicia villosa]|uniref:uncharacterized protein LOC131659882 n=1 Tax=Vicia villosa TaxID=3911 RepID=UPI00273BB677|nr:uncharacterized protein LOC131659882 [Vicia villosa]